MNKENHFSKIMVDKSINELNEYIDKKSTFQEDAVLAAMWELERSGISDEKFSNIEVEIEVKKEKQKEQTDIFKPDKNITDDPNAPLLYNPRFILVFGALFSVFAGGILYAINFSRLNQKKNALLVILTSLAYSILQVTILILIETGTSMLTLPVSLLGVYLIDTLFWKKYTADNLKYRKQSVWVALIIALLIWVPIGYLIIVANEV